MTKTDLTEQRIECARSGRRMVLQWFRVLAAALFVLSTAACSWVENVPSASVSAPEGGGSGGGAGSDFGVYSALWEPSPSAGIAGYRLNIDDLRRGTHREIDIPASAALVESGGRLAYGVYLQTDADYSLTLQAYSDVAISPPSNAIVVYGDSLAASAARAVAPQTALASGPSAATASGPALAIDDLTPNADESSVAASTTAVPETDLEASEADTIASADLHLLSLELDGAGTHLVGHAAAHVDATALTFSTWVRPFSANSDGRRNLVTVRTAAGHDQIEIAVTDGTDVSVAIRDAAGEVLAAADFAAVLERDVWQHMALVIDPTADAAFKLHVAGSIVTGAAFSTGSTGALPVIDGALALGGLGDNSFAGRLGHTAIFERALEDAVIEQLDVAGHEIDLRTDLASDAAASALIHYWRMGENEGTETDLGASGWPVDLGATGDGVYSVIDAPLSL